MAKGGMHIQISQAYCRYCRVGRAGKEAKTSSLPPSLPFEKAKNPAEHLVHAHTLESFPRLHGACLPGVSWLSIVALARCICPLSTSLFVAILRLHGPSTSRTNCLPLLPRINNPRFGQEQPSSIHNTRTGRSDRLEVCVFTAFWRALFGWLKDPPFLHPTPFAAGKPFSPRVLPSVRARRVLVASARTVCATSSSSSIQHRSTQLRSSQGWRAGGRLEQPHFPTRSAHLFSCWVTCLG